VAPTSRWLAGRLPRWIVAVLVFGALWYLQVERLSRYWAVESEYSFGWLVPVLCFYLFFIRWRSRPAAQRPAAGWVRLIFGVAAFGLLPTWLIAQANADWRVVAWLLTAEVVGLSLCTIYWIGGRPWLRHFAFSICLIAAATPWPTFLESKIVHVLTQLSTVLTVGALNLWHIDAVRHGNLIELRTGVVGLDEACSGIQSLQAALMMTLFLGELYQASIKRRVVLLISGAVIAFVCNGARTFSLAAIAAKGGPQSVANWHDPLGYVLMAACFLLIIAVSRIISGPLPALSPPVSASSPASYPYRVIVSLGAWILFIWAGTEIWYRLHAPAQTAQWSIAWPIHKSEFAEIPFSKTELDKLAFNKGGGAEWSEADGSHWVAYFFQWAKGPSWSRILARGHRPEVCFPAAGYKACGDHGMIEVQTEGLTIPFHALDFEDGVRKFYVFFCLWEDGVKSSDRSGQQDRWTQLTRLRSVLLGQRSLGQQTFEIVISGYDSPEQAATAFRREIVTLINTGTQDAVDASGSLVLPQVAKRQ
jgi:exosortase